MAVSFAGRTLLLPAVVPLNRSLFDAGAPVESPCGGRGKCGRCRIRLAGDVRPDPTAADRRWFTTADLGRGFRLACQHLPQPGMAVEAVAAGVAVPPAAGQAGAFAAAESAAAQGAAGGAFVDAARKAGLMEAEASAGAGGFPLEPLVEKVTAEVAPPAHEDYRGDWERLSQALPEPPAAQPSLDMLRELPGSLRQGGHRVTVVRAGGRVLAVEPGDTSRRLLGVALDIGTSTLAASLVDLATGVELAAASAPNPQAAFGADLMTRLGHAFHHEGRRELQKRVVAALNDLIHGLCRRLDVDPPSVYAASVVGNTAMHHLFLGLDVEPLGLAPYVPAVTGPLTVAAGEVGLAIHPRGAVYCLPCIAGFAGSDIAAVLLATRLWEAGAPVLVIDLGTNGEILLGDSTGILACSAPAGPAFEGGAIAHGMRALPGAIQAVAIDDDVRLDVIGGGPALGLCGSGLVDAVAALLNAGVLDPSGRFRPDRRGALPPAVARRLDKGGNWFVLAWPGEPSGSRARDTAALPAGEAAGASGTAVTLTQKDVRQLQLAKGAIRAGINVLLTERGIRPEDLAEVLLAGTFGNYVREESALAIGLLPPVPAERVRPIGNATAAGARQALLSRAARETLELVVRRVRHVPLAMRPDFQEVFIESTTFPG